MGVNAKSLRVAKRHSPEALKAYVARLSHGPEGDWPEWVRINELIAVYLSLGDDEKPDLRDRELRRHLIVSLVAVIQSAVRRAIAHIIDSRDANGESIPEPDIRLTVESVLGKHYERGSRPPDDKHGQNCGFRRAGATAT